MKRVCEKIGVREKIIFIISDLILTLIWTLGIQISFNGSVWGSPEENYIKPLNFITVINFIIFFMLNGFSLLFIYYLNRLTSRKSKEKCKKDNIFISFYREKTFLVSFILIMIAWLPYLLSYFPGGVYIDTFGSIDLAYDMDDYGMYHLNNHHPILYILLWRGAILISRLFDGDLFLAVVCFQIAQFVIMSAVVAYLITWIKNKGLCIWITIGMLLFVMFFPLFPLYAISLWKDTLFSLALLLFILHIADSILNGEKEYFTNTKYLLKFVILGILVAFTRNNGKYIVFITMIVLSIVKIRKKLKYKKMIFSFFITALVITTIQGPVYDTMGYNIDTTTESLGIPLQQISYLVYYDYDLTEDEKNYIDSIVSINSIKEKYKPCLFDSIKWYASDFNSDIIEQDFGLFLRYYINLMLKYPVGGIKAYMLATAGFWAPNISSADGYIQNAVWDNHYDIKGIDLLKKYFGFTIKGVISHMEPISSAVFLLITIYVGFILFLNRDYGKIIIILPAMANWITVMIATPIACSLRYVYILILIIPIEVMLICMSKGNYRE